MKKIIYANYTKAVAVILFIASIVLGTLTAIGGVAKYRDEEEFVYKFESDFSESQFFAPLLVAPENAIRSVYFNSYYNHSTDEKVDAQMIEDELNNLYCFDKINYYVAWNDTVLTNCSPASPEDLMQAQFYSFAARDNSGRTARQASQSLHYAYMLEDIAEFDRTNTIMVCTSIKDAYVEECRLIWERQAVIVNDTLTKAVMSIVLALLLFVYLICVCGKNQDGEYCTIWVDSIWAEIHLALIAGSGLGAVVLCAVLLDEYVAGFFPLHLLNMVMFVVSALASGVVLTAVLSLIRNLKCKRFVESSIICRIVRWAYRTFVKVAKWFWRKLKSFLSVISGALAKKTGIILIGLLLVYTAAIGICGILTPNSPIFLLFALYLFGFACFVFAHRAKDIDEIKKGANEIRNGNLSYKIPERKSEDLEALASDINDIAMGLDESVSAKLKAERLKTDLITNVSHDLKTPLTSIISYTELLSNVAGLPDEAKDYIQIIAKKSDRLKNLTQDLFDISKVQSGNENIVLEKLDIALLINQSLGEHDSEIKKSGLNFCVHVDKELYIAADGRKMSRVMSNLISNILKYTMPNTRVFISAAEADGAVVIELKNVASYPMDFDAEEIIGRFVRGDESRTIDGNGLGLAIARSYTEACGGTFHVVTDGDLFKAIITFSKYN